MPALQFRSSLRSPFSPLLYFVFSVEFSTNDDLFRPPASADVSYAIYDRYAHHSTGLPVSYVAHITGAVAGLIIGLVVLKNFSQQLSAQLWWWISLGFYLACTVFAILFNVFHPYPYEGVAQRFNL